MTKLEELSEIYNQYRLRSPKFTQITINDNLINRINKNFYHIKNKLSSNMLHQNIAMLDYEIRNILYFYSTSIVPLKEHFSKDYFMNLIERFSIEFSEFLEDSNELVKITKDIMSVYELSHHPFELALQDIIAYSSMRYLIITKKPLHSDIVQKLTSLYNQFSIEFKTYTEFEKNVKAYDNVIFIGTYKIFSNHVLQHINANHFYFITYSCYYSQIKFENWIDHNRIFGSPDSINVNYKQIENNYPENEYEKMEITNSTFNLDEPTIPESVIINFISTEGSENMDPNEKLVECKLIELEGNDFLFEQIGNKAKCDVVTHDLIFERKPLKEILVGEYIILMDFNNWDDLKDIANHYFEKQGINKDRQLLEKLKKYLSNKIEKYGIERYTKHLNNKLNLDLKEYQLLGLTKKESIKLQDDSKFLSLLKNITKTEEVAIKYFKACRRLSYYHKKVGRIVRKELRDYLVSNPKIFENIDNKSNITISNMEYLKVTVCKVKRISKKTYQVPTSRVGVLLDLHNREVI